MSALKGFLSDPAPFAAKLVEVHASSGLSGPLISPYSRLGKVDSAFYSRPSMLARWS